MLEQLGVKLYTSAASEGGAVSAQLVSEEQESRQQYWLIALAILLWVLGVETWLAGRAGSAAVVASGR
jgi:TRAP-type uncharacterized transport system fused permease subunit